MKSALKRIWSRFAGWYSARAIRFAEERREQMMFPPTERWIAPHIDPRGL